MNISTEKRVIEAVERFEAMERDFKAFLMQPVIAVSPVDPGLDVKEFRAEWEAQMEKIELIRAALEVELEVERKKEKVEPDTKDPEKVLGKGPQAQADSVLKAGTNPFYGDKEVQEPDETDKAVDAATEKPEKKVPAKKAKKSKAKR